MSLINDALKRAKQAQQKSPPLPAPVTSLRPATATRPGSSALGLLWPIAVAALFLLVGGVVVWFVVARAGTKSPLATGPNSKPSATIVPLVTASKPAPVASLPVVEQEPAPVIPPVATTNLPAVVAEAPPAWPKLQGIFYRPDRPAALLNGKTVFVGGNSGEFRVAAITQQSVTIVRSGVSNILSLAE